jgi:hypothetical protein
VLEGWVAPPAAESALRDSHAQMGGPEGGWRVCAPRPWWQRAPPRSAAHAGQQHVHIEVSSSSEAAAHGRTGSRGKGDGTAPSGRRIFGVATIPMAELFGSLGGDGWRPLVSTVPPDHHRSRSRDRGVDGSRLHQHRTGDRSGGAVRVAWGFFAHLGSSSSAPPTPPPSPSVLFERESKQRLLSDQVCTGPPCGVQPPRWLDFVSRPSRK